GRLSNDLTSMVGENLRAFFSSIIHSSFTNNQPVTLKNLLLDNDYRADITSDLIVDPISKSRYLLLTVSDHLGARIPADAGGISSSSAASDPDIRNLVQSLEKDLAHAHLSLQTMMGEMESTNEELQASNEELVASNEAMQSA